MSAEPENLDGDFELIERDRFESLGMFATRQDAEGWAETHAVKRYEIWCGSELVAER